MARVLPWATGVTAPAKAAKPRATPHPKRERSKSSSGDEANIRPKLEASPSSAKPSWRKRAHSRTPSTSPPPGPPQVEYGVSVSEILTSTYQGYRFMRDGYDADDRYMMVEDEFHSIATDFTVHLHHAEYKRLQKKAREASPKAIPKSLAEMSLRTRQKLDAENLRATQGVALKLMASSSRAKDILNEESVEESVDEPWSGTHLAGLMTSSSQRSTALVGLEQIRSSTRAARGFARGESDSPEKKKPLGIMEIFGGKKDKPRHSSLERSSDMDDDDLDVHPPTRSLVLNHERPQTQKGTRSGRERASTSKPQSTGSSTTGTALKHPVIAKKFHLRSKPQSARDLFVDDFDDLDGNVINDFKPPVKPHASIDSFEKGKLAKEKERKVRASEIPTFLV